MHKSHIPIYMFQCIKCTHVYVCIHTHTHTDTHIFDYDYTWIPLVPGGSVV